jgi:hypothetical protein
VKAGNIYRIMNKESQQNNSMVENWSLDTEEVKRNNEHGMWPMHSKEEEMYHILRCEGTKIWRDIVLDKKFRKIDAMRDIRRLVGCKIMCSSRK